MPLHSSFTPISEVRFPPFLGRQLYMGAVDIADPVMPDGYEDYHEVVTTLLRDTGRTEGVAYLTVDEKILEAGQTQRKPLRS